jgi:hypothetical protein
MTAGEYAKTHEYVMPRALKLVLRGGWRAQARSRRNRPRKRRHGRPRGR